MERKDLLLKYPARETVEVEFGSFGNRHHGHDTGLYRIGNYQIGGLRHAPGHIQTDHHQALVAYLSDGPLNITTHQ